MTIQTYEYRCDDCHNTMLTGFRGDRYDGTCPHCESAGPHRRRFSISVHRPMQEHWNQTVQAPVSSMQDFKRQLKIKSEEYMQKNPGIEVNFQPVDISDRKGLGVTDQVYEIAEQKSLVIP